MGEGIGGCGVAGSAVLGVGVGVGEVTVGWEVEGAGEGDCGVVARLGAGGVAALEVHVTVNHTRATATIALFAANTSDEFHHGRAVSTALGDFPPVRCHKGVRLEQLADGAAQSASAVPVNDSDCVQTVCRSTLQEAVQF